MKYEYELVQEVLVWASHWGYRINFNVSFSYMTLSCLWTRKKMLEKFEKKKLMMMLLLSIKTILRDISRKWKLNTKKSYWQHSHYMNKYVFNERFNLSFFALFCTFWLHFRITPCKWSLSDKCLNNSSIAINKLWGYEVSKRVHT